MKTAQKTSLAVIVLICGCCLLLLTGGICAYLISVADQTNQWTVGENVTQIEEVFEPPETIKAGQSYEKKVKVRNIKGVPCYIRVFAEFSDPQQADAMQLEFNSEDWTTKQGDGYYYYKKVLSVGEATEPLFEGFHAEKDSANLELIVYSESVQAAGTENAEEAFAALGQGGEI